MNIHRGKDEWADRIDYADVFRKRAIGELPQMESGKAAASFLKDEIREGDKLLDVGCGAGHYLRSIHERVSASFQYVGVDATERFVDAANEAWKNDAASTFRQGDIYELPFETDQFDIVMCNNVLLHLPSIAGPVGELVRVCKRFLLIRTLIGERSFKVQEVYSKANWPFSSVPPEEEFNHDGEPVSFGYENIYSTQYFKFVVQKAAPKAKIEIVSDTFFDEEAINKSADTEGLPNATRVVGGMQTLGYIITPWTFALIRLG